MTAAAYIEHCEKCGRMINATYPKCEGCALPTVATGDGAIICLVCCGWNPEEEDSEPMDLEDIVAHALADADKETKR